jgi:hypothetical protein
MFNPSRPYLYYTITAPARIAAAGNKKISVISKSADKHSEIDSKQAKIRSSSSKVNTF